MSTLVEPVPEATPDTEARSGGLLASFSTAKSVLTAVKTLRDAGYRGIDVHSPHPIHGLDDALALKGSPLPWAAMIGAAIGLGGGMWMAWWMNAVDYPFIISGKPMFSVLPSLPVSFELAILLAAFGVFGCTLLFGGLPNFANQKFRVPEFARATDDRFLLAIDADDEHFDEEKTRALLEQSGGSQIAEIPAIDPRDTKLPRPILLVAAVLAVAALIPPVLIAKARSTTSTTPRVSFISDMDHQPKFKAQTTNSLFADGRSMRPQVAGTIARGDLREDDALYLGLVTNLDIDGAEAKDADQKPNWVTEFPLAVDEQFIRRGKQRYEIYCSVCHGIGGDGDGLATLRALELEQGTWVKPTSLHAEPVRKQPVGQLYHTIANGVRKMPGYAAQIPVKDRWAIVAYLRALQKTRTGTVDDVPKNVLPNMRELN